MSKRRAFNKESLEWRQEKASTHHEVHSSKAKSTLSHYSKRRRTSDNDQDQHGLGGSGNVTADELSNKWQIPTRTTHLPHTNNNIVNINRSKRRLFQVENDDDRIYDKNTRTKDNGQSARESFKVASRIEDEINLISEAESSDSEIEAIDNHRIRMLDMPDKRLAMKTAWTVPNTTLGQPSTDKHKSKTNEVVSGVITSQLRDLHLDNNHLEYRFDNSNIRLISPLKDCDSEWDGPHEIRKSESTSESLMKFSAASNLRSSASIRKDSFQESSTIRLISPLKDDDDSLGESGEINLFPKCNYNFTKDKNDAKHHVKSDHSKLMDNFRDSLTIRLISPLKDAPYNLDGSAKVDFIPDSESESFMRKKSDEGNFKKSETVVVSASSESELNADAMEDRSILRLISPVKDLISDGEHSILESIENEVPRKKNHFNTSRHLESAKSTFIDQSELYSSIRLISPMRDDISKLDHSSETNVGLKSDRLKNNEDNFNPWTMAVVNHFNKTKTSASSDSQNSEDEFQVRLISPDLTDLGLDFNEDVTNVNKLNDHAEDDKCNRPIIWKPCRKLVFPPSKFEVIRASEFQSSALNVQVSKSTAKTVSQPMNSQEEAMIQFNDECNETDSEKCFAKVVGKQRLAAFYRGSKSESSLDHCFSQLLSISDDD